MYRLDEGFPVKHQGVKGETQPKPPKAPQFHGGLQINTGCQAFASVL